MNITSTQISLLEALEHLQREYGFADNKILRNYYNNREGSGLPFFDWFGSLGKRPGGAKVYQKTIYRNVKKLEQTGLVKVLHKPLGKKKRDVYVLSREGVKYIERMRLKEKVVSALNSRLEILQTGLRQKIWTVDRANAKQA
jgi:hypothetical protein